MSCGCSDTIDNQYTNNCEECGLGCYDACSLQLDTSNFWCNRVIAAKCDWTHYYVDPCELCNLSVQWPNKFWDLDDVIGNCIPNGLIVANADCTWVQARPLSWLINQLTDFDTKVKVNALDPSAGYLSSKIDSPDNSVQITVDPTNSIIHLKVDKTDKLSELTDWPGNYSACPGWFANTNPKLLQVNSTNTWWTWYCVDKQWHAEIRGTVPHEVTQAPNVDAAYYAPTNQTGASDPDGIVSAYTSTSVDVDGTSMVNNWIVIPENGRYSVNSWFNAFINKWHHGIRAAVLVKSGNNYYAINDMAKHARGVEPNLDDSYNLIAPHTDNPEDYPNSPYLHEYAIHQHRTDNHYFKTGDTLTLIYKLNTTKDGGPATSPEDARIFLSPNTYTFNFFTAQVSSTARDTGWGISVARMWTHQLT